MNALTTVNVPALSGKQLELVKRTIAADCNPAEFDLFIEAARSYGLDPFRRQILPLVFSKDEPKKRRMSIVVSRDGLRVIASRCRNYRPASEPTQWEIDESLKGPANPKGIVRCTVYLWQQDNRDNWFKVKGEADWDEFAPLRIPDDAFEWVETGEVWPDSGKPKKRKRRIQGADATPVLDDSGQWARMPKIMLEKCAEAQALRAGWPEQFGGLYVEEELEKARVLDLTATEIVEHEAEERRQKAIASRDSVPITWGGAWDMEFVPEGQLVDRVMEWLQEKGRTVEDVSAFESANREGLRQFWARHPNDALELKKRIEAFQYPDQGYGRDAGGNPSHPLLAG